MDCSIEMKFTHSKMVPLLNNNDGFYMQLILPGLCL